MPDGPFPFDVFSTQGGLNAKPFFVSQQTEWTITNPPNPAPATIAPPQVNLAIPFANEFMLAVALYFNILNGGSTIPALVSTLTLNYKNQQQWTGSVFPAMYPAFQGNPQDFAQAPFPGNFCWPLWESAPSMASLTQGVNVDLGATPTIMSGEFAVFCWGSPFFVPAIASNQVWAKGRKIRLNVDGVSLALNPASYTTDGGGSSVPDPIVGLGLAAWAF